MGSDALMYVSAEVESWLLGSVPENRDRYLKAGFSDLVSGEGWAIPLSLKVELEPLKELRPVTGTDAEVFNSLLVWRCLSKLTPALANEGRIWTRLSHVEGIEYARKRWVGDRKGADADKAVRAHFFANKLTSIRDDNAIGRLWWNAYIAKRALPERHHDALRALLKSADIRSNIVERSGVGSAAPLSAGILRAILSKPELTATEDGFRVFMKDVNAQGGGVIFEIMSAGEIDDWLMEYVRSSTSAERTGS